LKQIAEWVSIQIFVVVDGQTYMTIFLVHPETLTNKRTNQREAVLLDRGFSTRNASL
jgi:hypothetical protein